MHDELDEGSTHGHGSRECQPPRERRSRPGQAHLGELSSDSFGEWGVSLLAPGALAEMLRCEGDLSMIDQRVRKAADQADEGGARSRADAMRGGRAAGGRWRIFYGERESEREKERVPLLLSVQGCCRVVQMV